MRAFLPLLLVLNISAFGNIPKERYVIPTQKEVGIYQNRIRKLNENALFHVSLKSRLRVLEEKTDSYHVQDENGRVGWVEKRFVATVRKTQLQDFTQAEVHGYDDISSFWSILDSPEFTDLIIKLDRSFKDNLKEIVDREMIERIVQ